MKNNQIEKAEYQLQRLDKIPRGNTCRGVNKTIIAYLLSQQIKLRRFLDIPCGDGDFLRTVKDFFPNAEAVGVDVMLPRHSLGAEFVQANASSKLPFAKNQEFDLITSVSGVMEFDNTLYFFEQLKELLKPDGTLVVTNDNLLTIQDRFLYLLFGRTRQYRTLIAFDKPSWKIISIQNLRRILWEAGFEIEKIEYVPVISKEWLWLPLALPIYLTQWIYLKTSENEISLQEKKQVLPFVSLFSRHYVLFCRHKS
ncbi:MAG: class I SAM-dependent methyltransferase [Acidobacteriota bacterium]|nr:class I SAM-dependent methyltransferase [Acidobacteriota bacterium]